MYNSLTFKKEIYNLISKSYLLKYLKGTLLLFMILIHNNYVC